jgi:hypothetical protein
MSAQIHKNAARCRVCKEVVESKQVKTIETCACGAIAISGGSDRLTRNVRSWSDLEELSEYHLSWKDVLDCKQIYTRVHVAADNARLTGHSFFVFNGEIYRNTAAGQTVKTDKSISDLPCIVKV